MKDGWEIKKFECCIGKIPKPQQLKTSDYMSEGRYPIVSQEASMISGYTDMEEFVYRVQNPVVIFGDHTRILKYVDFDFVVGADGVKILIPTENLNAKYFYHFLKWYDIPSLGYSRHYKLLKEINIPIPPLPEQERIVSELDCINGILEKKREQIKELDALAQSIFYHMFGDPVTNEKGWEVKKLGELSNYKLSYGSGASAVPYNGEMRYVRITDITDSGKLNNDKVSPSVVDEKYLLNEGDLLFARSGATVGKTYLYNESDGKAIYAGYLIRFIPNIEYILPSYIFGYTKTTYYKAFIERSAQAVAQPNINAQQYSSLEVLLPPLFLQQSFATKIAAIEKQKELIKRSIAEVEMLLASRMQHHFG